MGSNEDLNLKDLMRNSFHEFIGHVKRGTLKKEVYRAASPPPKSVIPQLEEEAEAEEEEKLLSETVELSDEVDVEQPEEIKEQPQYRRYVPEYKAEENELLLKFLKEMRAKGKNRPVAEAADDIKLLTPSLTPFQPVNRLKSGGQQLSKQEKISLVDILGHRPNFTPLSSALRSKVGAYYAANCPKYTDDTKPDHPIFGRNTVLAPELKWTKSEQLSDFHLTIQEELRDLKLTNEPEYNFKSKTVVERKICRKMDFVRKKRQTPGTELWTKEVIQDLNQVVDLEIVE